MHCVRLSHDGLVYVCDRANDRIQVFHKDGTFVREILGTRRKDIVRLIFAEGTRFPAIAEFYHREVIARVLAIVRPILKRAAERGELPNDGLARFPQLMIAPGLVAIMWGSLFDKYEPLDVPAMMRAHIDILFGRAK